MVFLAGGTIAGWMMVGSQPRTTKGSASSAARIKLSSHAILVLAHRDDGSLEKRFVISTKPLSAIYITRLGRRLWQIDFFLL